MPKFSLEFTIGTILTLIVATVPFLWEWRKRQKKILICQVLNSIAIASIIPETTQHRITILYEREGYEPVNIQGAYVRFIRIANIGRIPVRRDDIAPADPLRIQVINGRVLDFAIEGVSRNTINLVLEPVVEKDKMSIAAITFDFLDYMDGALLRVVTDNPTFQVSVEGTVIGMPEGIKYHDDYSFKGGCLAIFATMIYLGVAWIYLIFYSPRISTTQPQTVQEHSYQSLIFLILFVFVGPALIMGCIMKFGSGPRWNNDMLLPRWFARRRFENSVDQDTTF